jgi:hypothetical protein
MWRQLADLTVARVKASRPGLQGAGIAIHQCVDGRRKLMIFTKVGARNPLFTCKSGGLPQHLSKTMADLAETSTERYTCLGVWERNLPVKSLRKPTLVMEPLTEPTYVVESHKGAYPCSEVSKGALPCNVAYEGAYLCSVVPQGSLSLK